MYFVRLQGCDVGCYFCDTKYTWRDSQRTVKESDIVERAIQSQAAWVCITGGEPYEQPLQELVHSCKSAGFKTHVETSGGADWQDTEIDWICLSPKDLFTKDEFKTKMEFKQRSNEIKCVVTIPEDIDYYLDEYYDFCRHDKPLILVPVTLGKTLVNKALVDAILKGIEGLTNARCMLQVQKIMEVR